MGGCMSAGYPREGFGIVICIVAFWCLWLLPGQGRAWEYSGSDGVCKLASQDGVNIKRNGEIIAGVAFVFRYFGANALTAKESIAGHRLPAGALYLTGVYPDSAAFMEGDPVTFKIAGEQFEGSIMRIGHDLTSKYFFSISGDSAAAILERLVEPSRLFNAALARDASARNKSKSAMSKGDSSELRLEAKTRHGEDVEVEIQEELSEQRYDSFMRCMEGVNAAGEKRSEIVEKVSADDASGDWELVPLFGSHVQIPEYCEIDEKESNSSGVTYVCGKYGATRNVIGFAITIGSIRRVDVGYLAKVRGESISRESRCGVDIYQYKIDGGSLYFIEDGSDYMKLQSVDLDQIAVLLEPLCRSRMR